MTENSIKTNLEMVKSQIVTAMRSADGNGQLGNGQLGKGLAEVGKRVQLLVATKTQPADRIQELFASGHLLVGENRVQEIVEKHGALATIAHEMHLIGPLQSNKINAALPLVSCIQTVDSLKLAQAISQRIPTVRQGRPLDVMVQVNVSGEVSKSGCEPVEAVELVQAVSRLDGLRVIGLMTIGLNSRVESEVREGFATLRRLRDACLENGVTSCRELSMGMSQDLEWAIAEGATIIRVGSAIFGGRETAPTSVLDRTTESSTSQPGA